MRKRINILVMAALTAVGAEAAPLNVCDFESRDRNGVGAVADEWRSGDFEGSGCG